MYNKELNIEKAIKSCFTSQIEVEQVNKVTIVTLINKSEKRFKDLLEVIAYDLKVSFTYNEYDYKALIY